MLEAWADNFPQSDFISALHFGAIEAYKIVLKIKQSKATNTPEKTFVTEISVQTDAELTSIMSHFHKSSHADVYDTFTNYSHDKQSRDDATSFFRNKV